MKGFIKTKYSILGENALIPDKNLITPPPNQFTHELIRPEPFYFAGGEQDASSDGEFPAGTKVVLVVYHDSKNCRVINEEGLYVEIQFSSLKKLD